MTCPAHVTYTGTALQPCTATATGAGSLSVDVTDSITYLTNTNAGNATATASYAGDTNHTASTGDSAFTIDKATSTVTVVCPSGPFYFTGTPITPACTATATGAGGLSVGVTPVTFSNNEKVSANATASAATYGGDANHLGSTGSTTFTITGWTTGGFYQPVDTGGVWNIVKNGSTVPLKFELFAGTTELVTTSAVAGFEVRVISCTNGTLTEDLNRAHDDRRHVAALRQHGRPVHPELADAEEGRRLLLRHHDGTGRLVDLGELQAEVADSAAREGPGHLWLGPSRHGPASSRTTAEGGASTTVSAICGTGGLVRPTVFSTGGGQDQQRVRPPAARSTASDRGPVGRMPGAPS